MDIKENNTDGESESSCIEAIKAFDDAGRFADAMELLKEASLKGDKVAMTELAHRLLVGNRAPKSPKHALYLLGDAAKGGDGRALARIAALTAAGAYVKQDWVQALQLLARAAAAGDISARGQLACLQPPGSLHADWSQMADRVPLSYWLQPAAEIRLHEKVRHVPDCAPLSVCSWLIGRATGRLQPALVYDSISRQDEAHEMRTNTLAMFDYSTFDVVQFLVQARMSSTCGYPIQHFEAPEVLHYDVGQQITPHFDFIDAKAPDYAQQISELGQRMVTFLLYLNDDYEGGETTFPELGIVHRGRAGGGLYFINAHPDLSPDRRMLHTGSPPAKGEKWIVTQFIVSKRLRP
jgi:hypothetical protein